MSNAQSEEVPFIRGMDKEPEGEGETTKLKFWIDGRLAALKGVVEGLKQEQGPKDYYEESSYERGMRDGARWGGYHEAPKNDNNLKAIIIGCTITLLSAFVLGAWKLSNDSAAIRAEFTEWKQSQTRWMDQIDRRLDRLEMSRP